MFKDYSKILYILLLNIIIPPFAMAQDISTEFSGAYGSTDNNRTTDIFEDEDFNSELYALDLQTRIQSFFDELNQLQNYYLRPFKITREQRLSKSYMRSLSDNVRSNEKKLKSIDLRWNILYQNEQATIANDEGLLTMVDDFNTIKSAVEDSIASRKNILQAINDFNAAEKFLADQDTVYKMLGKRGLQLSLSDKTAPQLETLKVKEQILFADIQSHYDKARYGAERFKVSQQEMDNIYNCYASLKNMSAKIQQMAYVPFFQRIKDYLIGIAAVAIIIMFVNMLINKINASRKIKENLKKYHDSLNQNGNNDIPSI